METHFNVVASIMGPERDRLRILQKDDSSILLEFAYFNNKRFKGSKIEIGSVRDLIAVRNIINRAIDTIKLSERSLG